MKNLSPKYDHKAVEEGKYDFWLKGGFFEAGDTSKQPFTIVIPPPNVTGKLHLGHAWDTSIQDMIIRRKRMQGYDALWIPGMDHAGIATQAKVDKRLKDQGISRYDIGREKFLEQAWAWKDEYASIIRKQWAALGLSLDYTKERFTLDEGLNKAVNYVFISLYNKGYIYQGERIINWDCQAKTALSNIEVIHQDDEGAFYYFKYPFVDASGYVMIATTRPETMFADQAIMVNPKDERFKDIVGKEVYIPGTEIKIPVITDEYVDMEFGTGCVKCTPAHDPNDYEVGRRHNLAMPLCMNDDGTMNEMAGKYQGMDRFACREALINDLKESGLFDHLEKIVHSVGHSERTGVVVEPRLSKQWFVKMDVLARQVLENKEYEFVPERFNGTLKNWLTNIQDWCISRQLWWGHRIPAWYKGDEVYVGMEAPKEDGWQQDSDVLDTWFSSALWPFSTLGWPDKTEDFERYYPNNCLVTGYDIIPFWVNRMTFQGLHFTNSRPFKDCLIHGLIRDKIGRKMSKSLGNGVDPMDVIEKYGADSLRFFLTTNSAPGMDLRYDEEKVKSTWNFVNKLWNASRYVLINMEDFKEENYTLEDLSLTDKWILEKLNRIIKSVRESMEKYEYHNVGNELYSFIWEDFCDWYIELSKANMNDTTKSVLLKVLTSILKMLHPFMPYVTEEIYQMLPIKDAKSIMISKYPVVEDYNYTSELETIDKVLEDIVSIRNLKQSNNITKDAKVKVTVKQLLKSIYYSQLKIKEENLVDSEITDMLSSNYQSKNIDITYYYQGSKEDESKKIEEINKLKASIERREKLLANSNYVSKAPANIVEADRKKLLEEKEKLAILENK